jgi:D-3-phosphoglycerate dehydrogenase
MKILVSTVPFADLDPRPLDVLKEAGAEVVINPLNRKLTESDLEALIGDYEVLIAGTEPISETVLEKANRLRLIVRVGIGLDSVDLRAARKRDILVSYTPDAPSPAVAELTIGLMIDLLRSTHVSNLRMHKGEWYRYFGRRLSEVTIGVIGAGRIGRRVIKHLRGFNCSKILVNDIDTEITLPYHPNCTPEKATKKQIYKEAEIISLHIPLTSETRDLIAREELSQMRRDALIINTSRGGIVNEKDLFEALERQQIGGAAIDVFEQEPYTGNLATLEACLLTAHMGSMSVDCRTQMEVEACEEVARFIKGERLVSEVPDAEYNRD